MEVPPYFNGLIMKKLLILFAFFMSGLSAFTYAQPVQVDARISEVYGAYLSEMSTEQLQWLESILQRCEVVEQAAIPGEELPLLSSLPVLEKYGVLDATIPADPQQLNPLKYMIKFNRHDVNLKYRIDGTSFVLLVHKLD